jgi:HSP20 family molecular chaperone IbpA
MRYRRLSYRYTMVMHPGPTTWPLTGEVWQSERLRFLVQTRWRPDADIYETASAVEIVVDLAGVDEDDFEVQLFEDVLVVEGSRQLPAPKETAIYHAAILRQGPFRLAVPLPAQIDAEHVEARSDRGLLRIVLPMHGEAR